MMKTFFSALFLLLMAGTVNGQSIGVVECKGRSSVSSWEAPDSILVAIQLPCGEEVEVIGIEKGYYKIRIRNRYTAYLDSEYIRILDDKKIGKKVIPETVPAPKESMKKTVPDRTLPPVLIEEPKPEAQKRTEQQHSFQGVLRSGWEMGLNSSYIKYDEPGFMQEDGITLSLYGNYTFRPNNFMFRIDGRMGFAGMDYESPISGEAGKIRDYIAEAGVRAGRTFKATDHWFLTPFAGVGYRYLFDGFGEKITSSGDFGYDRKSHYVYSPFGMESGHSLTPEWTFVASMEYDHLWHGWQHSEIGAVYGSDFTAINDQTEGWGVQASGKFIKKIGKYDIILGPYFRYWNIEDSDTVYATIDTVEIWLMEPANTSVEIGGMFGISF